MHVTHETDEIRALAHAFAVEQLRPGTEAWDAAGELDDTVVRQLAELGFFGMLVPETSAGMGFDLATYTAVLEELAWGEASVALLVAGAGRVATAIEAAGPDAVAADALERLAAGDLQAATAESATGVSAEAADADRLLTGSVRGVVNASAAGIALLPVAPAEPLVSARTVALVATDADGFAVTGREQTLGLRPIHIDSVELTRLRVPVSALITGNAAVERVSWLSIAAIATGIARGALDHARTYADVREQFGRKLRVFEGIQQKLGEMTVRVQGARAMVAAAANSGDRVASGAAKVVASEAAMWVSTQAVQIFGGYGYMRDYPVEKLMRDGKAMELMGDANELIRQHLTAELYRET